MNDLKKMASAWVQILLISGALLGLAVSAGAWSGKKELPKAWDDLVGCRPAS